jgi:DNA polymerase III delta subunit
MSEIQHDIFGGQVEVNLEEEEVSLARARGEFNIFALTDAIGARDKKSAWILYQKALASGMAPDEIFWRVAWIVKSMLLASKTETASETDMKDFPYRKAKGYAQKFSQEELEKLSAELVIGYHDARRGIGEIETLLEKLILGL